MHACNAVTFDQLLSVRDGEPTAVDVASHVEQCAACAGALGRLRQTRAALRALPQLPPPAYDGAALRAKFLRSTTPRSYRWSGVAAAAGISAIAILLVLANSHPQRNDRIPELQSSAATAETSTTEDAPRIDALVIRSQELESRLQRLPRRPRIERASTAATIGDLQNRIQWVDYQISLASDVGMTERQSAELWQDRIQLMDTLVKVRYAEAQRFAASY